MENKDIIQNNKTYWDTNADLWFGATALPKYGVKFATEDDLHLFGDVSGKKLLEILKSMEYLYLVGIIL